MSKEERERERRGWERKGWERKRREENKRKTTTMANTFNPSAGEAETKGLPGFSGKSVYPSEFQTNE